MNLRRIVTSRVVTARARLSPILSIYPHCSRSTLQCTLERNQKFPDMFQSTLQCTMGTQNIRSFFTHFRSQLNPYFNSIKLINLRLKPGFPVQLQILKKDFRKGCYGTCAPLFLPLSALLMASIVQKEPDHAGSNPPTPAANTPTATEGQVVTDRVSQGRGTGLNTDDSSRGRNIVRGKLRGRGKGKGQGRGVRDGRSAVAGRTYEYPSQGWKLKKPRLHPIMLKQEYCNKLLSERARLFVTSAVGNTKTELLDRSLPSTRTGHLVLVLEELLQQFKIWINERIALFKSSSSTIGMNGLYRYVSTLLLSHSTGISLSRTIAWLAELGMTAPPLECMRYIGQTIQAYSSTGRGNTQQNTWLPQRDQTQNLSRFESKVFRMTQSIFLTPMYTFATFDDDLYGTRVRDNQVETLSARKADRERHTADAVADALFRVTFIVHFRRRG